MRYLTYILRRLIPGDPATTILGSHVTPEGLRALRATLGTDKPLWDQYGSFLGRLFRGDLGFSFYYNTAVTSLIGVSLPVTLWLLVTGVIFTIVVAVPLAVLAAARRGGIADNIIRAVPVAGL